MRRKMIILKQVVQKFRVLKVTMAPKVVSGYLENVINLINTYI